MMSRVDMEMEIEELTSMQAELVKVIEAYLITADNPMGFGELSEIDKQARALLSRLKESA